MKLALHRRVGVEWLTGDVSGLTGDVSGLTGHVSWLRGDVTWLTGDVTGLWGDVDDCEITAAERAAGVDVATLVSA